MAVSAGGKIAQAADTILAAWRGPDHGPIRLLEDVRPRNLAQAYGIQEAVSGELGAIGGWQICKPPAEAELACAPLPLASIRPAPARVPKSGDATVSLSTEICFRLGRSLPDYDAPYTRDQVRAAIESCHPAVAVLRPRPIDPGLSDALTAIANSCGHWRLVHGKPAPDWPRLVTGPIAINVLQTGVPAFPHDVDWTEDPIGLLQWLANRGARWAGGLTVGQWVAIGLGGGELEIRTDRPVCIIVGSLGSIDLQFT